MKRLWFLLLLAGCGDDSGWCSPVVIDGVRCIVCRSGHGVSCDWGKK